MGVVTDEKRGCLAGVFRLLKWVVGVGQPKDDYPYALVDTFFSNTERRFYQSLVAAVAQQAVICPKVRLADIVRVTDRNHKHFWKYFNRIGQKHIDFLLLSPHTLQPLVGVELDDSSHQRRDRVERDDAVNKIFSAAGLPLIRVPAAVGYNPQALTAQLAPYLAAAPAPVPPSSARSSGASAPACPNCGVPMVVRTVSRGPNRGSQFYGCRNYPSCRQMLPLEAGT